MAKKTLSLIIAGLLVYTTLFAEPRSAGMKAEKQARFTEKVKAGVAKLGIGEDTRVVVKLRDKTRVSGYISDVRDDSFEVTSLRTSEPVVVAYADVAQVRGQNLTKGQKIAIGVGVAVVIVVVIIAVLVTHVGG